MNNENNAEHVRFRPSNTYYHANAKGTGSAIRFELHPAHDEVCGSIFMEIVRQKTVGSYADGSRIFPTFDWANKIVVRLDKTDLSQMLQVFRGIQESIQDGKGIFHQTPGSNTIIRFCHQIEPRPGYLLQVSRKTRTAGEPETAWFNFTPCEALELSCAIEGAMVYVCFGLPMVLPRPDKEAERNRVLADMPASAPVKLTDPF